MNDNRTPQEKYEAWLQAKTICLSKGWNLIQGWIFQAPKGSKHDLSAADLTQLDRIEKEGLFLKN